MLPQQYCLRWKHHHTNVQNMFAQLLEKERFCDVTLYCSPNFATQVPNKDMVEPSNIHGVSIRAHRVVLAACSELLGALLGAHEAQGEPVLVIDGAEPKHLKALLDYMYTGEMNVHHSQLASLLKTAEELRIKGLADIRWNNKDEPPDCATGAITTTVDKPEKTDAKQQKQAKFSPLQSKLSPPRSRQSPPQLRLSPTQSRLSPPNSKQSLNSKLSPLLCELSQPRSLANDPEEIVPDKINVNGGPPPLIKLPTRDKLLTPKRENRDSDSEIPLPKRQRIGSGTEHTDDESSSIVKVEREDWRHGNMNITAERVVGWGLEGSDSRDLSDDDWADAPADIGSFLHTKLKVDGDNSADDESNESGGDSSPGAGVSIPIVPVETVKSESHTGSKSTRDDSWSSGEHMIFKDLPKVPPPITIGPKSGPTDPRFTDVVKLSEYLQHGRRPQFWEENYVKRVMEAVRLKELEMKQAAEILGVSYGTLYGRYRDVYGCINRPYRAVRDFWQVKGPSEVLERLQRGEISLDTAASALGVSVANLAAHVADFGSESAANTLKGPSVLTALKRGEMTLTAGAAALGVSVPTLKAHIAEFGYANEFEPIPIEVDASLRSRTYSAGSKAPPRKSTHNTDNLQTGKKVNVGSSADEECIPVSIISTRQESPPPGGKWPTIRVASIDSLRGNEVPPTSPSQIMRTRPDLTIVAAKKNEKTDEDT